MIDLELNLETCIRCTELSYAVADGLGDDLRAELALLRQVHADAYALACTFSATRPWTREEAALAASQAALRRLINARPETPAPPPPGTGLTEAVIRERLAANPRTECADCGCEEGCVEYLRDCLRDLLAEIAPPSPGARADATNTEAA